MTVFSLALLGNHPLSVSLAGAASHLLWVTIGNVIGGASSSPAAISPPVRVCGAQRSCRSACQEVSLRAAQPCRRCATWGFAVREGRRRALAPYVDCLPSPAL